MFAIYCFRVLFPRVLSVVTMTSVPLLHLDHCTLQLFFAGIQRRFLTPLVSFHIQTIRTETNL